MYDASGVANYILKPNQQGIQHSFENNRNYIVSTQQGIQHSSDNEGRCSVIASCLARKSLIQAARSNTFPASSSSKVTPQPNIQAGDVMITLGASPRLVRSRAGRSLVDVLNPGRLNVLRSFP